MNKMPTLSYIFKQYPRYIFMVAVLLVALLSSCPVKSSIKTLAGVPVNTEQGLLKGGHAISASNQLSCVNSDVTELTAGVQVAADADVMLPVALFTAAFFSLFSFRSESTTHLGDHLEPEDLRSLPIFLRQRKLII